jgi:hypothetical protein
MIKHKTVFIVGAGASSEVNFALGDALTKEIREALDFRHGAPGSAAKELIRTTIGAIEQRTGRPHDANALFSKARELADGLATVRSIDAYIENHSHDNDVARLGKLAIASCLAIAETKSFIYSRDPSAVADLSQADASWLNGLFHVLATGVQATEVEHIFDNVSFVVFNYERSLEHYLQHAIARRLKIGLVDAGELVGHARIVHPYGSLGPLVGPDKVVYGPRLTPETSEAADSIDAMATRIQTFSESKSAMAGVAKEYIAQAERAIFLGIFYHPQNVELLRVGTADVHEIRATAYGMSPSNRREALNSIRTICAGKIVGSDDDLHPFNVKCSKLIADEELFLCR